MYFLYCFAAVTVSVTESEGGEASDDRSVSPKGLVTG